MLIYIAKLIQYCTVLKGKTQQYCRTLVYRKEYLSAEYSSLVGGVAYCITDNGKRVL